MFRKRFVLIYFDLNVKNVTIVSLTNMLKKTLINIRALKKSTVSSEQAK